GRRNQAADLQQGRTGPLQGGLRRQRRDPHARLRHHEERQGRRVGQLRFSGHDRRRLRGGAGGPQRTDPGTDGESVSFFLPVAHALVARKDLPVPAWLFAWGARFVLFFSFFALSVGWRVPRCEKDRWRPLGAALSGALLGIPRQIV